MAIFKVGFEGALASEEQIDTYYETAVININLLLVKYNIISANGQLEVISADNLKFNLSFDGFFQSTPLQSIFLNGRQQYIPEEIVQVFRSIISDSPLNIKAVFIKTFITLMKEKGWEKSLSTYFEQQYDFPVNEVIILEDLEDFSLGGTVYKATFRLGVSGAEKVTIFLKRSNVLWSYNELLYFHLQKECLFTASSAKMPWSLLNNEKNDVLLLSPLIIGVESDIGISLLTHFYKNTETKNAKSTIKKALEILIEAFIEHAVLGDLLGRNDRHLMNSLMALVVNGVTQNTTASDLITLEKVLAYSQSIITNKISSISLIDIDLKWLLDEKNFDWAFVDIDFGLSEINLLSLLDEFNNFNLKANMFFEQRKKYVIHYFKVCCQKQEALLEQKDLFFSAVQKIYPYNFSKKNLILLAKRINDFKNSKKHVIKIFKRYLLNYRLRLIHKETLLTLYKIALGSNNVNILNHLKEANLLQYLPPEAAFAEYDPSVFFQLQCFRGVLSKKDQVILSKTNRACWETIASNISAVTKKMNNDLFNELEANKKYVIQDAQAILSSIICLLS